METVFSKTNENQAFNATETRQDPESQTYTERIDSSETVITKYSKIQCNSLDDKFLQIQEKLKENLPNGENLPLIIVGPQGSGQQVLLTQWIEYHEKKKQQIKNDIILSHFSSDGEINQNYLYAIFSFLIQLREQLSINQKVQILQEQLRNYFSYWLQITNERLKNNLTTNFDSNHLYQRIILVIEGIDNYRDPQNNRQSPIPFWLPKKFPENIKVIISCYQGSLSHDYFAKLNCQFVKVPNEKLIFPFLLSIHEAEEPVLNQENKIQVKALISSFMVTEENLENTEEKQIKKCTPLILNLLLNGLIPTSTDIFLEEDLQEGEQSNITKLINDVIAEISPADLQKLYDVKEVYNMILTKYDKRLFRQDTVFRALICLSLTQKGLSFKQLADITGIKSADWYTLRMILKPVLNEFKGYWKFSRDNFQEVVLERYSQGKSQIKEYHMAISDGIKRLPNNSIRKLEEQTYHLFQAEAFFHLKQVVSQIENFLLLFNPNNQYDLCYYWLQLQEHHFDPVLEYNQSIEGFNMHYHPSSDDLFSIIVQVSRYLQEFSDFETYNTPQFRHPPLKGAYEEMDDIGLLNQLLKTRLFFDNQVYQQGSDLNQKWMNFQKFSVIQRNKIDEKIKLLQKQHQLLTEEEIMKEKTMPYDQANYTFEDPQQVKNVNQSSFSSLNLTMMERQEEIQQKRPVILQYPENLNIQIPANRQEFRKHYLKIIEKILKEEKIKLIEDDQPSSEHPDQKYQLALQRYFQGEQDIQYEDSDQFKRQESAILDHLQKIEIEGEDRQIQTQQIDKLKQYFNFIQHDPQEYYYKRWLWVQFPWACMSIKRDLSRKLDECFTNKTEYLSVEQEKALTDQSLKIVINAKEKQNNIMKKKSAIVETKKISMTSLKPEKGNSISSSLSRLPTIKTFTNKDVNDAYFVSDGFSQQNQRYSSDSNRSKIMKISESEQFLRKKNTPTQAEDNNFSQTRLYLKHNMSQRELGRNRSTSLKNNEQVYRTNLYLKQNHLNKQLSQIEVTQLNNSISFNEKIEMKNLIDTMNTSKVLQKSIVQKERSRTFNDESILQIQNKDVSSLLPSLNNNIFKHTTKEISIIDEQNNYLQQQLDDVTSKNLMLAKELKNLKVIEQNYDSYADDEEKEKIKQAIYDSRQKIQNIQESYLFSLVQIERLNIILKVCDNNQKQNEEWIKELSRFLNNLKRAIQLQKDEIKQIEKSTLDLRKGNSKYMDALNEKVQNEYTMMNQINYSLNEKGQVDGLFVNSDHQIKNAALTQYDELRISQECQETQNKEEKSQKTEQKNDHLEKLRKKINQIIQCIDITEPQFDLQLEYRDFISELQQNRELEANLGQKKQELQDLIEIKQSKINHLISLRKAEQNEKYISKCQMNQIQNNLVESNSQSDVKEESKVHNSQGDIYQEKISTTLREINTQKEKTNLLNISLRNIILKIDPNNEFLENEKITPEISEKLLKIIKEIQEKQKTLGDLSKFELYKKIGLEKVNFQPQDNALSRNSQSDKSPKKGEN